MSELWYSITEINGDNTEWSMHRSRDTALRANERKAVYTAIAQPNRHIIRTADSSRITVLQQQTNQVVATFYITQIGGTNR